MPAEPGGAGSKRCARPLQPAGGWPKMEDLAEPVPATAAEQTIAVAAECMMARLLRDLALGGNYKPRAPDRARPRPGSAAPVPR